MPTTPRNARILLKEDKAVVKQRMPFVIQLNYATGENKQKITLGIDAGYQTIGFSTVTEKQELMSGEVGLLKNMSERLKERSMYRTQRRNRLRFRKPRFNNRRRANGWLAPSIQHKFDSHIKIVDLLKRLLPVTKIIVEVANFDIQAIKNPGIEGAGYQKGEQSGFWNLREYILHRDNHQCQNPDCKNKAKEKILEVHHIGFWKGDRSDRPANLITLCTKCHILKIIKDFYMDLKSTAHCKYNINYHLVWCPKYRHKILAGEIEVFLKGLIHSICKSYDYDLLNLEIMPDHLHIFISAPPYISPTEIVKTIKSISAVEIFKQFPGLKSQKFWGSGLWSKGYYVGTARTVTAETIQRYIDEQKTKT